MKKSLACPKCDGRKLWRIDQVGADDRQTDGLNRLRLATVRVKNSDAALFSWGSDFKKTGDISAFVCAACGYTELWARGFEDLRHDPEGGVHLIDATPQRGSYR